MMAWPTLIVGALLVLIGIIGYGTATPNPETGQISPTALIPAGVGGLLILCGIAAFNDKFRKHAMHLAVVIGLVGFLGGFMPIARQVSRTGEFDPLKPSAISGELMILVCAAFVGLCVNSFIQARALLKPSTCVRRGA